MSGTEAEYLPSIAQILKRAGALEVVEGIDLQAVSRLPVFHSRAWKRAISEFLRWSGTTPDVWGNSSVFRMILGHGPAGARALFGAYRHDRLERAENFEEADTQLEAVRTVVSMAAYWIHAISWDLRDVPRLTPEEFGSRSRPGNGVPGPAEPVRRSRADARRTDTIDRFPLEEPEAVGLGGARPSSSVPVFPSEPSLPNLWKRPRRTDL